MTNQQANLLEKLYATEAYARIFLETAIPKKEKEIKKLKSYLQ